jgi:thiol-disulfide isomerase/thioredoxin
VLGPLPKTADGLRLRAQQLIQRRDLAAALEAAEGALAKEPKSRETLFLVADLAQTRAFERLQAKDRAGADTMFRRSAVLMRSLNEDRRGNLYPYELGLLQRAVYNEACSYALAGESEKALDSLRAAFLTFGAPNHPQLDTDTDLASLRKLPAFDELKQQVAARNAEVAKVRLAAVKAEARRVFEATTPFAFDFKLPNLEGKSVALRDFAGKVRIVDIWGTWCGPCAMEVPHFVALQKKYGAKGLQVLGINYEREDLSHDDAVSRIQQFSQRAGINYPCVLGDDATRSQVPDLQGYPTTLFLDRAGKVRARTEGYQPLPMIEAIVALLLEEGNEGAKPSAGGQR